MNTLSESAKKYWPMKIVGPCAMTSAASRTEATKVTRLNPTLISGAASL